MKKISDEKITKALKEVIPAIVDGFDAELFAKTQDQLEEYWHFKFNPDASMEINLYEFHDMLTLYGSMCEQWENHHNGHCCIVERVRDKYLMPKIKQFCERIRTNPSTEIMEIF